MGDIGLLGAKVNQGGDTVEGYHVVLGGGFGEKQAVAREVFRGVAFNELPLLLEHVLKIYLGQAQSRGKLCRFHPPSQCQGTAGTIFRINERQRRNEAPASSSIYLSKMEMLTRKMSSNHLFRLFPITRHSRLPSARG